MLVRLVLAWFVLTLGAASAAPVAQPATMALVCSEGASRVVLVDHEGAIVHGPGHTLDCPLCLPAALPPAVAAPRMPVPQPSSAALAILVVSHPAPSAGAPLPPRGPPAAS